MSQFDICFREGNAGTCGTNCRAYKSKPECTDGELEIKLGTILWQEYPVGHTAILRYKGVYKDKTYVLEAWLASHFSEWRVIKPCGELVDRNRSISIDNIEEAQIWAETIIIKRTID